jgi:proteasome lid subunit RPN8/RPN11
MYPMPAPNQQVIYAAKVEVRNVYHMRAAAGAQFRPRHMPTKLGDALDLRGMDDCTVVFKVTDAVYMHVLRELAYAPPERMGVLLGPKDHDRLLTHFIADPTGNSTSASFTIDRERLQPLLDPYFACGLDIKGYVHSHPSGCTRPSAGDLAYLRGLFARAGNSKTTEFFFPIVCDSKLHPYAYLKHRDDDEFVSVRLCFI